MNTIPPDTLSSFLSDHPDWQETDAKLEAQFSFDNFVSAFSFLTAVAIQAEKMNHHPEIYNVYNKVTLKLSTHEAEDQITEKDLELAKQISKFYNR